MDAVPVETKFRFSGHFFINFALILKTGNVIM